MDELTRRQRQILYFILNWQRAQGTTPTYQEIADQFNFRSLNSVTEHVRLLRQKQFLHPLPSRWLPGIGSKTAVRLNAAGLAQIGQIAATPVDMLALLLGSQAPVDSRQRAAENRFPF